MKSNSISGQTNYSYSLQPFYNHIESSSRTFSASKDILICRFNCDEEYLRCVPGNGQLGIFISNSEDFKAYCYGVLTSPSLVPIYGMKEGISVKFSIGAFANLFDCNVNEIDPFGMPLNEVIPKSQMDSIIDACCLSDSPEEQLIKLFSRWQENKKSRMDQVVAAHTSKIIWENNGNIRVKELEDLVGYSSRHIQNIVTRQVGISPKQLCRHIRFQHTLKVINCISDLSDAALCRLASELGYSDQAHLCNEFKKFFGYSPLQYIKEINT